MLKLDSVMPPTADGWHGSKGQIRSRQGVLGLVAGHDETEICREERLRVGGLLQSSPPGSNFAGRNLTGVDPSLYRPAVELFVHAEAGRPGEGDGVRNDPHVTQTSPLE